MNCFDFGCKVAIGVLLVLCVPGHAGPVDAGVPQSATQPATRSYVISLEKARGYLKDLRTTAARARELRIALAAKGLREGMSVEEKNQWFRSHGGNDEVKARDYGTLCHRSCELVMQFWMATCRPCALAQVPRRELPARLDEVINGFEDFLKARPDGMIEDDLWQGISATIDLVDSDYAGPAHCVLARWLDGGLRVRGLPTHWEWTDLSRDSRKALHERLVVWRKTARTTCRYSAWLQKVTSTVGVGEGVVDMGGGAWSIWAADGDDAKGQEAGQENNRQ